MDLAGSMIEDGMGHKAIESFASLGCGGRYLANTERDLFKWLVDLFGFRLQTYTVSIPLQVSWY